MTLVTALALAFVTSACRQSTAPDSLLEAAAGIYVLDGVSRPYPSPSTGTIVLTRDGSAERRIQYPGTAGQPASEFVLVGTFTISGDSIRFALRPPNSPPTGAGYTGGFRSGTITLGYPGPADGWFVETYRRR